MSFKFIAISLLSIGLAGSAMAQTAGGVDSIGRLSVAPVIGGSGGGSVNSRSPGTDPGITNSTTTTGNGGVDLNSGRSTINPGGVNPNLRSSPGCAGVTSTDEDSGSLGEPCPQ